MGTLHDLATMLDHTDTVVLPSDEPRLEADYLRADEKRLRALLGDPSPLGPDDKQLLKRLLSAASSANTPESAAALGRLSRLARQRVDGRNFMDAVRRALTELDSTTDGARSGGRRDADDAPAASTPSGFNPTGTYVLDDECIEDLEQSRLTGIVRSLSADEIPDIDWADED